MTNDVFEIVKESLSMEQVLNAYGFEVSRSKKCVCPFHNDHSPSMQVYSKSFYCYSCGTGGDVIKFVALLNNKSNFEAVRELNGLFRLGLDLDSKQSFVDLSYVKKLKEKRAWEEKKRSIAIKIWSMAQWLSVSANTPLIDEIVQHSSDDVDYYSSEEVAGYVYNRYKLYHG